jgi:hypothetical protein
MELQDVVAAVTEAPELTAFWEKVETLNAEVVVNAALIQASQPRTCM